MTFAEPRDQSGAMSISLQGRGRRLAPKLEGVGVVRVEAKVSSSFPSLEKLLLLN
jgi:hypothetical protein